MVFERHDARKKMWTKIKGRVQVGVVIAIPPHPWRLDLSVTTGNSNNVRFEFVSLSCNEVRITKQPKLTAIIQSRRLSTFGHIARVDGNADTKTILTAPHQRTGSDHQSIPVSRG